MGLPADAHTDFIFSVIGEQLGIVGALFVLFLLASFVWLGIRTATQSRINSAPSSPSDSWPGWRRRR